MMRRRYGLPRLFLWLMSPCAVLSVGGAAQTGEIQRPSDGIL